MSKVKFSVDGQHFDSDTSELTVSAVLERAGKTPGQSLLESEDAEYRNPDDEIKIRDGDRFKTRTLDGAHAGETSIRYEVNGETRTTADQTLTVEEILRAAGPAASIDVANVNEYYLESISDGRKYERPDERVAINDGDRFLALYRGRTPVA